MAKKDIILFTGQSGIQVEKCLDKLRKSFGKKYSPNIDILKFEREMIRKYRDIYNDQTSDDRKIVIGILSLPPLAQMSLWNKSFDSIRKSLKSRVRSNMKFLSFHACFYHQKNREFLSPINFLKLKSLSKRVKMIVVFVDDCYDIYKRLLARDEMFFEDVMANNVNKFEAIIKSIWNLLSILSWRELEIAFSRKISELLNIPLFIVPVKHPVIMIQRLISNDLRNLKIFYLAHPITSVRKRVFARQEKFSDELCNFAETGLYQNKNLILFIPDTIDELRIKDENSIYTTELTDAWPLPFDESSWLFQTISKETKDYKPLNPKNYNCSLSQKKSLSYVVSILAKKIDEQITARDYGLIEQSKDGVIIYQPYWEGDISGGALKEAQYNSVLKKERELGNRIRRTFILEKMENLGKYRITELFKMLLVALKKKPDNEIEDKLYEIKERWKNDVAVIMKFYKGKYPEKQIRNEIEKILNKNYDFSEDFLRTRQASLHGGSMLEKEERLKKGWKVLCDNIMKFDPFGEQCMDICREYLIIQSNKFNSKRNIFLKSICSKHQKKFDRRKK